ncbi:MAG: hypothetical protein JNK38_00110 [Acidobacteria bacterium]|nr:hypothetical protein [Acidobacteriota bacterium]
MFLKLSFRWLVPAAVLCCATVIFSPAPMYRVAAVQSPTVPAPPTERADRFGVYNWNINDAAKPGATDQLNWGANLVADLGTRTIRIALATRDDYRLGISSNLDLVQLAQHPAYDRALKDARFRTVMLTTYSRGAMASNWSDGYSQTEYDAERDEIRRLGEYLLSTPAFNGKTFIVLNWEGDNAMSLWPNKRSIWDAYTNWIRARVEGVKLARQKYPASSAKLFSGLEFNQIHNWQTGELCGSAVSDPVRTDPLRNRCLIDYVAPQVEVDYYSYSSWESLIQKEFSPNDNLKQHYKADLSFALSLIKARRPEITEHNFIVGEYGFERARYGDCHAANATSEMFDALEGPDAFQASYAVFWQVVDNAPFYGVGVEYFGLYKTSGNQVSLSPIGETFRKRLAGQPATNYTGCPQIRTSPEPGILNGQGQPNFQINPDTVISIYAQGCCTNVTTPFSASGNTVHFDQTARHYQLPRDNAQAFYESPTQINFSMPAARRTGWTRVYVTDARGFVSNAQAIPITCQSCPSFTSCGILETNYQTMQMAPGDTITLSGNQFSPTGNTVVIEQRVTQHTFQKWTLTQPNLLSESASQLVLKLPNDLVPERETILYVTNAQGLESAESSIPISSHCTDCPPRLKPCLAFQPQSGMEFRAGQAATVTGRFPASGNKIVLEQSDKTNRLYRYEVAGGQFWEESDKRIRFALPTTLFAGRALLYVMDSTGRESRAQEITVSPHPLTLVSSANYRGASLAVESLATVFGNALATTIQNATSSPLPDELAGTRVVIKDSANVERNAPLFFVSPTQINFQIPPGTAAGTASVTVISGFGSSSFGSVPIANVSPGLFAANATGKGLAAAVVLRIKADNSQSYEPVALFDPASNNFVALPIDLGPASDQVFLLLFGTGIRNRSSLSAVTVQVGNVVAPLNFAGAQMDFVGLDQINALLPRSLAGQGDVDVVVSVDGLMANPLRVNIK